MFAIHGPFSHVQLDHLLLTPLVNPLIHFPKSDPQGKKSQPTKTGCRLWRQLSPNRTAEYSDGNHNSQALSGDVNGGAATVGTMSLPLTPLVTDIQWPPWLKMGPAPKKRNVQSTCGLPMHMGGVRQAARCPYGAAEPPWAMVRCYSSSWVRLLDRCSEAPIQGVQKGAIFHALKTAMVATASRADGNSQGSRR